MWLRRGFFLWLFPAAFVLPLWLLIGWGVFNAGAWAFLWVLFIAVPSVFFGELVLALLIRARPTVRAERAVSWRDVAGLMVWHALTVTVGFYSEAWFVAALVLAIVVWLALFWSSLWQLWNEARTSAHRVVLTTSAGPAPSASAPGTSDRRHPPADPDVFIIREAVPPADER